MSADTEKKINKNAKTKVALKTSLSIPRLEKLPDQLPHTRPKPVPLTCTRMAISRSIPTVICAPSIKFCILRGIIPQIQRTSQ